MPHAVLRRAIAAIAASNDSLADPVHGPGYLSQVGRAAFNPSFQ